MDEIRLPANILRHEVLPADLELQRKALFATMRNDLLALGITLYQDADSLLQMAGVTIHLRRDTRTVECRWEVARSLVAPDRVPALGDFLLTLQEGERIASRINPILEEAGMDYGNYYIHLTLLPETAILSRDDLFGFAADSQDEIRELVADGNAPEDIPDLVGSLCTMLVPEDASAHARIARLPAIERDFRTWCEIEARVMSELSERLKITLQPPDLKKFHS